MRQADCGPRNEPNVLYVCYEFPVLTQTFTLGEVRGLVAAGVVREVVSCIPPREAPELVTADGLPTRVLPRALSARSVGALISWLVRRPLRTLALLGTVAAGTYRDQGARCWARGFLQLLWGARLAKELRGGLGRVHLHAQFIDAASTVAYVAARLLDGTYSFTNHTAYNPYLLVPKLRHAAVVISISEFDRRTLVEMGRGTGADRIRVAYQGIDFEAFPGGCRAEAGPRTRLLSVAALREKKGHQVLVEAFARLVRGGIDAELVIVGDGPERDRLEDRVRELGIGDRVDLAGAEPAARVWERLAGSDLFVLAALRARNGDLDGIPISLMEAMAAGVPVVSTRISGIPELIRDGVDGRLAEPGDSADLARILAETITDPAGARSMARQARDRVATRHDRERCVSRMVEILGEAVR